jgi:HD-like signal output (HDOD) protein/ActR/RegA family two-component response regulator
MATKQKILFVEGETGALRELSDQMAARALPWEPLHCVGGLAALNLLQLSSCAAVVTTLRLPDMPGEQLLDQASRLHPDMHRVVLADLGDLDALLHCVGNVNPFLVLPCELDRLLIVLERAVTFNLWLPHRSLRELLGRLPLLPSPEEHYTRVVQELQSPSPSLETVGELVARDPAMTARVLQLGNSASYGLPTEDVDPVATVRELGLANVKSLLLLAHTYSNFNQPAAAGFSVADWWQHSHAVARRAAALARLAGAPPAVIQESTTAGLLHDLGKLALFANLPGHGQQVSRLIQSKHLSSWQAEQEVLGATHSEVGGWLLGVWGLPVGVVEAVALHHRPARFLHRGFCALTAVHLANAFVRAADRAAALAAVDAEYLRGLDLWDQLPAWWEATTAPTT